MAPFKPLLSPKTQFVWTQELGNAFNRSKGKLIQAIQEDVRIFDPKQKTCLSTDWSTLNIRYWLRQKYCSYKSDAPDCCDSGWKIAFTGSRFLRAAEHCYASVEGEALALVWALEDTKFSTLGCDNLIVITGHKPLVKIFGDR